MRTIKIGLALVGLLVGAGFATGKEVTQYFVSFGTMGVWGVLVAAITTAGTAIVAMTAGSFSSPKSTPPSSTASHTRSSPR